jgi:hypothetical protein
VTFEGGLRRRGQIADNPQRAWGPKAAGIGPKVTSIPRVHTLLWTARAMR